LADAAKGRIFAFMSKKPLEIVVRHRGGSGKAAKWEWAIYEKGAAGPLRKGMVTGAERKAYSAANHAEVQMLEAQAKKKTKK
jgi:hypothetical protein